MQIFYPRLVGSLEIHETKVFLDSPFKVYTHCTLMVELVFLCTWVLTYTVTIYATRVIAIATREKVRESGRLNSHAGTIKRIFV